MAETSWNLSVPISHTVIKKFGLQPVRVGYFATNTPSAANVANAIWYTNTYTYAIFNTRSTANTYPVASLLVYHNDIKIKISKE